MSRIIFEQPNGERREVDAVDGVSVMQNAINARVSGIVAECGGQMACATCHVFVDPAWLGKLPPRSADEQAMLDVTAVSATELSRLSCQIEVEPALDGMVVRVPERQV